MEYWCVDKVVEVGIYRFRPRVVSSAAWVKTRGNK